MAHIFHIFHFSICLRAVGKLKVAILISAVNIGEWLSRLRNYAVSCQTILQAEMNHIRFYNYI